MKRFGLIVGFAACLSLVGNVAFAQNADVTGKWTMTLTTPRGERVIHLDLMQEGTEITGTSQAEGQEETSEVTGTIDGNDVTLNMSMGGGRGRGGGGGGGGGRGGSRPLAGVVDGDAMSGEFSFGGRGGGGGGSGGGGTITWKAIRDS